MLNRGIKQNTLWEKENKTQTCTLFTLPSVYTDERWCLCVSVCMCVIWYWCGPVVCVQMWFQRRAKCNWVCVGFAVGVYVVSATPLYSRVYVTYSYVFVFCYVSKSFFFLYNSFSSSSSTATRLSGGIDVTRPHPPKTPSSCQSLKSGQEGRSSVTLVRRLPRSHLRVSGRGGRWHLGNTCLFILFLCRRAPDHIPNLTLPTQMGSMVEKTCNFIW